MPRSHQPCGTDAAYSRHYRAGEEVCGPCKAAHTEAGRVRRLAKKAAAVTGPECCCSPCCCDSGGDHCRQAGCPVCIPTQITKETPMSDARECTAEFIDGLTDYESCGCADCGDAAAGEIESRVEEGLITREEALAEHAAVDLVYAAHDDDEDEVPPSRAAVAHQSDAMEAFLSGDLLA